jgi:hypothetical protein
VSLVTLPTRSDNSGAILSAANVCRAVQKLQRLEPVVNNMKILAIAVLLLLTLGLAQAEPRQSERNHNYILRRQEAGQVSGVPTMRRIIGKREIDIYRSGLMFEGDHVVGVKPR